MISVSKASEIIQQNMLSWQMQSRPLLNLNSEFLAEDIRADRDYPPIPRSMMDGIAIHSDSLLQNNFLIEKVCKAGEPQAELVNISACVEIMTGAAVPKNCHLVIPYEDIEIQNGKALIKTQRLRAVGEFVHAQASDCQSTDIILKAGLPFNGPRAGIAASMGYSQVKVKTSPRVLVISTGDELIEIENTPQNYQLRRSNSVALMNSLKNFGFEKVECDHLSDNLESMIKHYQKRMNEFDYFIYSGGVSEGKFDFLPQCWRALEITEIFHKVSQKPGKPMWFGQDQKNNKLIFGLPGNPISSLVCLHRYLLTKNPLTVLLAEDFHFDKNLTYFLPVKIQLNEQACLIAHPVKVKNSGEFTALAQSDGFIELPADKNLFLQNEVYSFYPWTPWGSLCN